MAEITIDTYECSGCGTCVELCPEVFRMDGTEEKAEVIGVDYKITDKIEQAVAFCPEKCITIEE